MFAKGILPMAYFSTSNANIGLFLLQNELILWRYLKSFNQISARFRKISIAGGGTFCDISLPESLNSIIWLNLLRKRYGHLSACLRGVEYCNHAIRAMPLMLELLIRGKH